VDRLPRPRHERRGSGSSPRRRADRDRPQGAPSRRLLLLSDRPRRVPAPARLLERGREDPVEWLRPCAAAHGRADRAGPRTHSAVRQRSPRDRPRHPGLRRTGEPARRSRAAPSAHGRAALRARSSGGAGAAVAASRERTGRRRVARGAAALARRRENPGPGPQRVQAERFRWASCWIFISSTGRSDEGESATSFFSIWTASARSEGPPAPSASARK
jgi:hypothetical protein